jgi:hypothetical protein
MFLESTFTCLVPQNAFVTRGEGHLASLILAMMVLLAALSSTELLRVVVSTDQRGLSFGTSGNWCSAEPACLPYAATSPSLAHTVIVMI